MTQRRSRNARRTRRTRRKAKTPAEIRDVMASMGGGSRGWYLRWGERAHRKRRVRADENGRTPGPVARARAWGCVCRGSARERSERVGKTKDGSLSPHTIRRRHAAASSCTSRVPHGRTTGPTSPGTALLCYSDVFCVCFVRPSAQGRLLLRVLRAFRLLRCVKLFYQLA